VVNQEDLPGGTVGYPAQPGLICPSVRQFVSQSVHQSGYFCICGVVNIEMKVDFFCVCGVVTFFGEILAILEDKAKKKVPPAQVQQAYSTPLDQP
jgi:hypothetical protein